MMYKKEEEKMEKEYREIRPNSIKEECRASRMSARSVLSEMANKKQVEETAINLLISLIPWDALSRDQEEILWRYFVKRQ